MNTAVPHNARSTDKQSGCGLPGEVDAHVTNSRLTKGEQRVLEIIKRCDFTGEGCYPTQDELAFLTDYKRPYVNACVKSLERKGRLRIEKRRRPGCKWSHNVYFVRDWSPNVRRGICNLRRAFRDSKSRCFVASSDTERTARLSRAQAPGVNPFLTAPVSRSCGREGAKTTIRRFRLQEARRRHLQTVHIADLTCPHCAEKQQELEQKAEIIQKLARENSELAEKYLGATAAAEAAGRAAVAAKAQRTKQAKQEAKLEQVREVVEHWRSHRPRTGEEFGEPGTKSFEVIEKALVLMAKDPDGPVKACCEAIDGLHMAPYQAYDERFTRPGKGRKLRNEVQHALGDEQRIERCRRIVRTANQRGARWTFEMWRVLCEVEQAWLRQVRDEVFYAQPEPDDTVMVDGIPTRVDA